MTAEWRLTNSVWSPGPQRVSGVFLGALALVPERFLPPGCVPQPTEEDSTMRLSETQIGS